jgi:AraC-like DNA-binding protein
MTTRKTGSKKSLATTLYIKNMVCDRCIRVVKQELDRLHLNVRSVSLGEVVVGGDRGDLPLERIRSVLEENGFELIEDRNARIIERIKLAVVKLVHRDADVEEKRLKISEYLSRELALDYHYLSTLFSSVENVTIEHYVILQRIERAKELLKYGELTLSEIAYKLTYSSVQHLSSQFGKVTGMTPSRFKSLHGNVRKGIDLVLPK